VIPWSHIIAERRRVRVGATVRHKPSGRLGRVLHHCEVTRDHPCHAGVEWCSGGREYEQIRTSTLHEVAAGELAV
jgi:hypothetical protein